MRRWLLIHVTATWVLAALAGTVRADEKPVAVALEWSIGPGAQSCMHGAVLRAAVSGQTERNTVVDHAASVVIRGRTQRVGAQWQATIRVEAADGALLGRRELSKSGADCAAFDQALIVVLAMMVDSSIVDEARAPPAEPVSAPTSLPRTRPAPHASPDVSTHRGWRFAIIISAMSWMGRIPGVAGGGELSGRVEPPILWPVEVGLAVTQERTAEVSGGSSRFRWMSAAALACPLRLATGSGLIELCAGPQVGVIRAQAFGFVENRQRSRWVVDARAEARVELALVDAWFARAVAGVAVTLLRPEFSYRSDEGAIYALYGPSAVAGFVQIAIGVRFR